MAMRQLLQRESRTAALFGAHPGSVRVQEGVDLTAPILDHAPDASRLPWAVGQRAKAQREKRHRAAARPLTVEP
jgi:hypothetical protein